MSRLWTWIDELSEPLAPTAAALGVFDGVHRGHQALLAAARDAASGELTPIALTFEPHPASVLAPGLAPQLLTTLDERAELLLRHGAHRVLVARFDSELAALSPDEFAATIVAEKLCARQVVIGDDFRFGKGRAGDGGTLTESGATLGFGVHVVPTVEIDGVPARSSTVRSALLLGDVTLASHLLGRSYALSGIVTRGRQLGRTLGYPTANLFADGQRLVPLDGIYAAIATLADSTRHRAAVSIGANPTIAEGGPTTVEAYLLDGFAQDIYDQTLTLEFVARLRPTQKFDSLEALVNQIADDVEEIKRVLPR